MPEMYQIKNYYNEGQYQAIADLCGNAAEYEQFTEWDHFYLLLALNRLGRYDECLQAYKVMLKRFPEATRGGSAAAAALYNQHFKNCDTVHCDLKLLTRQLDFIIKHDEDHSSQFSRVWLAMKITLKAVSEQVSQGTAQARLDILNRVDPLTLSDAEGTGTREGKPTTYASPRENWYSEATDALVSAGQYEECIRRADEASQHINTFHYNNDVWFAKRKARALAKLGRADEARALLTDLTAKLNNEWLWKDLFELERAGDADAALLYGCKCASTGERTDGMAGFCNEFAIFLMQQGRTEMAMLERQLAICLEKAGSDKPRQFAADWAPDEEISGLGRRQALERLRPLWQEVIDSHREYLEGKVDRLNPEKRLGFIQGPDQQYFFRFSSVNSGPDRLRPGARVRFAVEKGYDHKKAQWSMNAVGITVLD